MVNDLDYLDINNLVVKDGNLKIIVDIKRGDFLHISLTMFEDLYDNLKIKVDSGLHQIWINQKYDVKDSFDLNETFSEIKNIDNLDVELDVINNSLIVVGNLGDFKKIFEYFKKINYNIFEFYLQLIEHDTNEKYYKLKID